MSNNNETSSEPTIDRSSTQVPNDNDDDDVFGSDNDTNTNTTNTTNTSNTNQDESSNQDKSATDSTKTDNQDDDDLNLQDSTSDKKEMYKSLFGDSDEEEGKNQGQSENDESDRPSSSQSKPNKKRKRASGNSDDDEQKEETNENEKEPSQDEQARADATASQQMVEEDDDEEIDVLLPPTKAIQNKLYYFKVGGFLGIDHRPYDSTNEKLEYTVHDDVFTQGRVLPPSSVIRWRVNEDGQYESNARMVRWSDGSTQLFIGSESFDISKQDIRNEHSYLFIKQRSGVYRAQGEMNEKYVVRQPIVVKKSGVNVVKERKVKLYAPVEDPEAEKVKLEQQLESKIKGRTTSEAIKSKKRGAAELTVDALEGDEATSSTVTDTPSGKSHNRRRQRSEQLREEEEEEADELDEEDEGMDDFVVDDDDDDGGSRREKKAKKSKKSKKHKKE